MKKIELFIMPYTKENEGKTRLIVDGNNIDSKDNRLTNLVVYQPMRKWLTSYKKKLFVWSGLLAEIIEEFNDKSIRFIFHGCKSDYILFKKNILTQQLKLNRNNGDVNVAFEHIDKWNPKKTAKELAEILDDLRIEADNWGEDDILKEIDRLKSDVCECKVTLKSGHLLSLSEFQNMLQKHHISIKDDALLTIVPVDGSVSASGIRDIIAALTEEGDAYREYVVVRTSTEENPDQLDAVISFNNDSDTNIKYIENDGENYVAEIEKIYYLSILPNSIKKAIEILHMFPDHDTNSYLIDIADRIEYLFNIEL